MLFITIFALVSVVYMRKKLVIYFVLSLWFLNFNSNLTAQNLQDSLEEVVKELPALQKLDSLTAYCWSLRERSPELAIELGKEGLEIAEKLGRTDKIAQINNYIGVVYLHYLFRYNQALPHFHYALEASMRTNDSTQMGYAYNNLGDAFYLAKNGPIALKYAETSLEIFSSLNDSSGIAYGYVNLALAARLEKNNEKARTYFEEALRISQQSGNTNSYAYVLYEIGNILTDLGDLDSARDNFRQSYELHLELNNLIYAGHCLTGIGNILLKKNQYENALAHFKRAEEMQFERENTYGLITVKLRIAITYSLLNDKDQGERELLQAMALSKELALSFLILDIYQASAEFYRNLGDPESATSYFGYYLTMYDSLFSVQQIATLTEIQNEFNTRLELSQAEMEVELRQRESWFLYLILVMILCIVILIFWRYRSQSRLNKELRLSNQSKDKLFSIISHDLRNPFVSMIQYFELLKDESLPEKNKKEFIENLEKQANSTFGLLENLLHLSANRSGKIDFQPEWLEVEPIVKEQTFLFNAHLQKKDVFLDLDFQCDRVYGDPNMFSIVIRNLISNAVKYSPVHGVVSIKSEVHDEGTQLTIQDQGLGMDKETISRLFTTELVTSSPGTQGEKGTGIGLSLCKEFIDRHGGQIEVISELNTGTIITVLFPKPN